MGWLLMYVQFIWSLFQGHYIFTHQSAVEEAQYWCRRCHTQLSLHCTLYKNHILPPKLYLTTEKNVWQPLTTKINLTKPQTQTHTHTHWGVLNNTALHSTSSSCEHAPLTVRGTAGGGGGDSDGGGGYLLGRYHNYSHVHTKNMYYKNHRDKLI